MNIVSKIALAALVATISSITTYAQDKKTTEPDLQVTGSAQLRLRFQSDKQKINNKDSTRTFYENKLSWNLRFEKKVHANLSIKFNLSNPEWENLATIDDATMNQDGKNPVYIQQAEADYTNKGFGLGIGILNVPVTHSNTMLAFAENGAMLKNAIHISNDFSVYTNSSISGLKLFYKTGEVTSTLTYGLGGPAEHKKSFFDLENTGHRIMLDVAVKATENINVTPSVSFNTNANGGAKAAVAAVKEVRNGNGVVTIPGVKAVAAVAAVAKKVPGLGFGVDASTKFNNMLSIGGGIGYGMLDSISAVLVSLKPVVKLHTGALKIAFSYGMGRDSKVDKSGMNIIHADFAYAHILTKNFEITPRVRLWINKYNNTEIDGSTTVRPELIFKGKF